MCTFQPSCSGTANCVLATSLLVSWFSLLPLSALSRDVYSVRAIQKYEAHLRRSSSGRELFELCTICLIHHEKEIRMVSIFYLIVPPLFDIMKSGTLADGALLDVVRINEQVRHAILLE